MLRMGRDPLLTPVSIETAVHDMTIDEWKGLALRTSIQLGRRPGTDGEQDDGLGALRDIYEVRQIVGRPPMFKDGKWDEGTGLAKLLVEHHQTAATSKKQSAGALVTAGAAFLMAVATVIQHVYAAPPPPVSVPVPIAVPAPAR
jgi:hypothetical protein